MKTLISILLISILGIGICDANSGDTIVVPYGSNVTIDGIMSGGEWADASTVNISSIGGTVYFKHTATHLLVAFTDLNGYSMSSGIYVDKLNNEGVTPQTDDIWIHGSAGPFEFHGTGTAWQQGSPANWTYNNTNDNEYSIDLSKIGVSLDSNNILGVLFSFLDWSTTSAEITWPTGGNSNLANPSTWATMIIENIAVNIEDFNITQTDEVRIFPNPTKNFLNINLKNNSFANIEILNTKGQLIKSFLFSNSTERIDVNDLSTGVYFVKLTNDKTVEFRKIIKE
ncbi:T9SS type A sorting domain-containing protein [Bacteroidota bacterium]